MNLIETCLCSLIWYYIKAFFIYLFKTASLRFLSYILFELLDVEHGSPKSHKNVKCNSLGLSLAIVPLPSRGNFIHYNFQIVHNISHKMQFVSPLSVAALAFNITLRTLPRKITLNFLDNASNMTYSHFFQVCYRFKNFSYNTVT